MYRVIKLNSRYKEYLDYLSERTDRLVGCWEDILRPAIENSNDAILDQLDLDKIGFTLSNHDESKYSEAEFSAYCSHYLAGDEYEDSSRLGEDPMYDYAQLHHQHSNPHHPQYWIYIGDDGIIAPIDMPLEYICEMLCSWGCDHYGDPSNDSAREFWDKHQENFMMTDKTIDYIEKLFQICPDL